MKVKGFLGHIMKNLVFTFVISMLSLITDALSMNNNTQMCVQACQQCSNPQAKQFCGQNCLGLNGAQEACMKSMQQGESQSYTQQAQQNWACQSCNTCGESTDAINQCLASCKIPAAVGKCQKFSLAAGQSTPKINNLALQADASSFVNFLNMATFNPLMTLPLNIKTQDIIRDICGKQMKLAQGAFNDLKTRLTNDTRGPKPVLLINYIQGGEYILQGLNKLLIDLGPSNNDTAESLGNYMTYVAKALKDAWDVIFTLYAASNVRDTVLRVVSPS